MKILHLDKREVNRKEFIRRSALETDSENLINEPTLVYNNGKLVIAYIDLSGIDTDNLRWACLTNKYDKSYRTAGLITNSNIFGYMPRRTLMADYCHVTAMAKDKPKNHLVYIEFASQLEKYYRQYFPDVLDKHYEIVKEKILPEWRIDGTPFTSGIVNKDNPLKYHYDAGNFQGVLSNMVAFKKGVEGGRLVCPEYDIKFEISDNTLLIFDGQSILHGVTPIKKTNPKGYRYTVVYYSLQQLWKCEPLKDEVKRIRAVKKQREFKRLDLKPKN